MTGKKRATSWGRSQRPRGDLPRLDPAVFQEQVQRVCSRMEQDGEHQAVSEPKLKWTPEEDNNLKILVKNVGNEDWKTVSSFLPGRSERQCMQRWSKSLSPVQVKGPWTEEEDQQIVELVAEYGTRSWPVIAQRLGGRVGKQCRERWHNHLDPQVDKSCWTRDQDLLIYKAQREMGNRWAEIARLLPGRTDNAVKNRWHARIKKLSEQEAFRREAEAVDLSKRLREVLQKDEDIAPITPNELKEEEAETAIRPVLSPRVKTQSSKSPQSVRGPDPSSRPHPGPKPNPVPKPGPSRSPSEAVDQKTLEEAALKMIAEDMLPISFVEGAGFRSFLNMMCPQYSRLSQRSVGLRLYGDVERTHKPQLIRDLKASLAASGRDGVIHVSADLWAGPSDPEPVVLVRLHFLNEAWRLCRPVVAFRRLDQDLSASLCRELEAVLLSYGIFPQSIGYALTSDAKHALTANRLFCDYTLALNKAEAEGEETLSFLTDQLCDVASPWCDLQLGTRWHCVGQRLQLVLEEALETCSDVKQLLRQLQSLVSFFRSKTSWSEMLVKACGAPLWPPPSSCRWNSSLQCWRRMLQESTWGCVLKVLDQAQGKTQTDTQTPGQGPPVVSASREQLVDVLGLLGPLESVLQTLQASSSSLSSLVPSLLQLDRGLRSRVSSFPHFSRALRTGLRSHFQSLLHDRNALLAAALDPKIKLKPFSEKPEQQTDFLCPPSKSEVTAIIEAALGSPHCPSPAPAEESAAAPAPAPAEESAAAPAPAPAEESAATPAPAPAEESAAAPAPAPAEESAATPAPAPAEESAAAPAPAPAEESAAAHAPAPAEESVATPALRDKCTENQLKRKAPCALPQPPQKCAKTSELQCYLSEPTAPGATPAAFWSAAHRFPALQSCARRLLSVPVSCGGFDRVYSLSTSLVRARRNSLPTTTTERLLLYREARR